MQDRPTAHELVQILDTKIREYRTHKPVEFKKEFTDFDPEFEKSSDQLVRMN